MPQWAIKCYCNAAGRDVFDKEFSDQTLAVRQEFRAVLNGLRDRPRNEWTRPAGFDQLGGKYKALGKLRFKVANVQHRPLGFFPGGLVFVLLVWATERDGKFDPPDVRETALRRIKEVENDGSRAHVNNF